MSELSKNKVNDVAAIRAFYRNEVEVLTAHQEDVRKRLLLVQSLMLEGRQTFEIISILEKDFHISNAQAFRDLKNATGIYGDMRKAEKEGIRWMLYDMAMQDYNKYKEDDNWKAAALARKDLIAIAGVDREDPDTPDFSKLQPPPIVLLFSEEMERQIERTKGEGVVDLTELFLNPQTKTYEHSDTGGTEKQDK